MAFPMLQSSGVRDVGPERFSVANAATRTALQLGTAVGIALLVAVLGDEIKVRGHYLDAWLTISIFATITAVLIAPIPRRSRVVEPVLAAAPTK